jgi:hypothetical protein
MVLLRGKTKVDCPKDKQEVNIKQACARCDFSGPVSLEGMYTLIVACKFEEVPKPKETIQDLERPESELTDFDEEDYEES